MTKTTKTPEASVETLDTWEMASAVLTGLRKTTQRARDDCRAAIEANTKDGTPFARSVRSKSNLLEALIEAERTLYGELRRVGKASGRSLPAQPST